VVDNGKNKEANVEGGCGVNPGVRGFLCRFFVSSTEQWIGW